jgi:hypothetical protein
MLRQDVIGNAAAPFSAENGTARSAPLWGTDA